MMVSWFYVSCSFMYFMPLIIHYQMNLNDIFTQLGVKSKYGASTTWMGKLKYRLDSRRQGGCPILAIGIGKENVKA